MKLYNCIIPPVLALLLASTPAASHEFWISADSYQVASGSTIDARFRNGENLSGVELAFFDRRSDLLQSYQNGQRADITPRNGDRPAVVIEDAEPGLFILAHETKPSSITYREWAKFLKFADHKDFRDIAARHDGRGLPREDFKESYSRHVKALIGVGDAEGADTALGLKTEFVALTNPYTPDFMQKMRVQLLYQGAPRADAQVEIFEKPPGGEVSVTLTRTNADGFAEFDTKAGHEYLIDAVVLRAPKDPAAAHAWETLWAGMTFSTRK